MKVAVTGGTGFVGRYVVADLEGRSLSPLLVCRPDSARRSPSGLSIVSIDIQADSSDAFDLMDQPDVVIHLAWDGLPNYKSSHHFEHESPGHFRFLNGLLHGGLKHLVVAGTCYEYGMQWGPLDEQLEAKPVTAYGLGKDVLRRQLECAVTYTGASLTCAGLFYPFGDGQSPTSLWPQLKQAVEDGARTFDMSPGDQLRDYLPIRDVASYLVSLALTTHGAGVVNVCSGQPRSIRALVEGWIRDNGWSIELNLGRYPYPDYEPLAFWGDPRKLRGVLQQVSAV